jgi:subtilisin family serine protease
VYRDGIVLAGFRANISMAQQLSVFASVGAQELRYVQSGDVHVIRVPPGHVLDTVNKLKALSEVRYAEPDFAHYVDGGPLPNDTSVGFQWAVQNTGQSVNGTAGTPGADERTLPAWGVTTGTASVVVAVLDTGTQYTHPDLITNLWNNPGGVGGCPAGTHGYNVLTNTCDPMDDDVSYAGHGSHVSGILGAVGNNAMGVAGVNWSTSIMAMKWVASNGNGFSSDLVTAMDWVVTAKQAGATVRVVNDSATWPGTAFSQAVVDEIDALGANDILFVAAAGNTGENNDITPRYPCSYNRANMICAAASDQNDRLWTSSNFGITTVKLAAPGVNIYSTMRQNNYGYISGSSMAAAQVSGTAALILSLGYQSVANLRSIILNSVDVLSSLTSFVATGGRLNVCKAVPGCSTASTSVPANMQAPAVTGLVQYGSLLGASAGTWSGIPTSFTYQWYRCDGSGSNCSQIAAATGQNYPVLASADVGSTFRVTVTGVNGVGSNSAQSTASSVAATASSPFGLNSTILNGATLSGSVQWKATPAQAVNFVQFYIDGVLRQTIWSSPYAYNQPTTGMLDTSALSNGTHVLGLRALSSDNRTYAFYGATVTVSNGGGGSGIAVVQSANAMGSGVVSVQSAFPSANTAGNLILAFVRMSSTSQTVTLTDTAGNAYIEAVRQTQTSDGHQLHLFYAKNVAGGANTVSATFSGTNNHPWLAIYEYRGLSATSPLDRTSAAQGTATAVSSGSTAVTSSANELVFAGIGLPSGYSGTETAGSGFILGQKNTSTSPGATESALVTATGSYAGTFALSSGTNWSALVATFSAASVSNPVSITTSSLPNGLQNTTYSATLTATGGSPPYTWSILSGTLPAGLALNASTGAITGTPTGSGTSSFTAKVQDAAGQTATAVLSITISPNGGGSGIAVVQSANAMGSGVVSVQSVFPSANTAGNLILALVRMSTTSQTVTVTDSAGNVYAQAVAQTQTSDGHQLHLFYAKNIAGGANTVSATFSGTNNHPWLAIYEYHGLSATSPLDRTSAAQGSVIAVSSGSTALTSNANELVFAGLGLPSGYSGTETAGSGFVLGQRNTSTSPGATESALVTATGSYAGTFALSSSTNWSALVATFK